MPPPGTESVQYSGPISPNSSRGGEGGPFFESIRPSAVRLFLQSGIILHCPRRQLAARKCFFFKLIISHNVVS